MTKATGIIKNIKGNTAEVVIERISMCGDNCSHCGICGDNKTVVSAVNDAGAKVGDRVEVCVVTGFSLAAAALVYAVPLAILFAGLAVMTVFELTAGVGVGGIAAVMLIWFAVMSVLDKRGAFKKYSATITQILQ